LCVIQEVCCLSSWGLVGKIFVATRAFSLFLLQLFRKSICDISLFETRRGASPTFFFISGEIQGFVHGPLLDIDIPAEFCHNETTLQTASIGKHIKTTTTIIARTPRTATQDDLHIPHPAPPPPLPPPTINAPPPSRRTSPVRSQTAIKPPLSKLNNPTEPSRSSPQPSASPAQQPYTTAFQQRQQHLLPSAKQSQSHHLTLSHYHQETSAPQLPQPRRAIRIT